MTLIPPTALEEAAKAVEQDLSRDMVAWVERYTGPHGCDDDAPEPPKGNYRSTPTRLATAAITAYLAQREKEGWVMVPRDRLAQHASWLRVYIEESKPENWRDMKLRASRQLDDVDALLAAAQNGGDLPPPPRGK